MVTIARCNMLYNGVNYCSSVRDGDLEVKIIIAGSNLWNTRLGCRHLGFFPDMRKVRFPGIIFKEGYKSRMKYILRLLNGSITRLTSD